MSGNASLIIYHVATGEEVARAKKPGEVLAEFKAIEQTDVLTGSKAEDSGGEK
jgi:hypothetical protein